jgi:hypothetical protein
MEFKHTRVTPYWARANGLVANFNKSLKKAIRVATIERKKFIYHSTCFCPHICAFFVLRLLGTRDLITCGSFVLIILFHLKCGSSWSQAPIRLNQRL